MTPRYRPFVCRLLIASLFALRLSAVCAAPLHIEYAISPEPPVAAREARTRIAVRITGLRGETALRVQMPVWSPGDYHAMHHARYVADLQAGARAVTRPDENTWEVRTDGADAVTVTYALPNTPPGFFSENVQVRGDYAFYNGPATFVYVVGHKEDPVVVRIALPSGWTQALMPLDRENADTEPGSISYRAPDYDTLADSPLLAGAYAAREFTYAGRPHTIAFFNNYRGVDYDAFVPVLRRIVAEECRLMHGPPYARYVFFLDVDGRGGGLEHLNSHRYAIDHQTSPLEAATGIAHEFFHLWNVKRIRPAVLGPFNYIDPPRTRNLWFSEGVTEYYAELVLVRSGLITAADYLRSLSGEITAMQRNTQRLRVTADDSSWKVWEARNSSGYGFSYYRKGALIGLCLDLRIRAATDGRRSLDDVMRDLMARHRPPKAGFGEDGIREAVIRVAGAEMGPFYDQLCRSTAELPYAPCLQVVGLTLSQDGGRFGIEADPTATPAAVGQRNAWLRGR